MLHVFSNLIKNSIFFIKKAGKGKIFIKIYEDNFYIYILFKDTGYGIKDQYKDHIFKRFFSRRRSGIGIGLHFCKTVIESYGGSIICQSEFGEYTDFIIKLKKIED